jgi:hypothetical protein
MGVISWFVVDLTTLTLKVLTKLISDYGNKIHTLSLKHVSSFIMLHNLAASHIAIFLCLIQSVGFTFAVNLKPR